MYENNKSAAQPIEDAIYTALGGDINPDVYLTYIDSALVSAQRRQRFYVTNFGKIEQPEDRGILLRDILENGWTTDRDKSRTVLSSIGRTTTREYFDHSQNTMVYYSLSKVIPINAATAVAGPIRIGTIDNKAQNSKHDSKQYRVYSPDGKSTTLCGEGGGVGAKNG